MRLHRLGALALPWLAALPALLPVAVFGLWGLGAGSLARGWPSGDSWLLLGRTALFALTTALAAGLLGTVSALRILTARGWRLPVLLATLLVPPAVHGLGWASVASELGALARATGGPDLVFQGTGAALWVNAIALAPLATSLCAAAFLLVDPGLLEAARVFQPAGRVTRRILAGLAAPHLAAALLLVFVLALQDFTVPALFSVPAYPMGLFARFASERDPGAVLVQALPLLAAALPLAVAAARTWKGLTGHRVGGPARPLGGLRPRSPVLDRVGDGWLLLPALAPLLLMAVGFDAARWGMAWSRALPDLVYSLALASVTAGMAMVLGAFLAPRMGHALALLVLVPLLLPPVLPSLGVLHLFQSLPPSWEPLAPVVAALARALPLAALLMAAARRRRDPGLEEAARLLGRNPWRRFRRITLPMAVPSAAAAAVAAFTLTLGECASLVLVLPPGRSTLATRLFNLLHYGAGPEVAALSILLSALSGTAAALAVGAVRRSTRWRMNP